MKNLSLKMKLFGLIATALLALVFVGAIGWMDISNTANAINEIGKVRLPSVVGLELIDEGQTAATSNNRYVAFFENNYKAQDKFAEALKERETALQHIDKGWKLYEPLPQTKEEAVLWQQFVREFEAWKASEKKLHDVIEALSRNSSEQEQKDLFVKYFERSFAADPLLHDAKATLEKIIDLNINVANESVAEGDRVVSSSRAMMLGSSIAALIILLLLGMWITSIITRPLQEAVELAGAVAKGDLTQRIEVTSKDEAGQLLQALKDMNDSLARIVGEVRGATDSISTGAQQIAAGNADLSSRTEEQASSLEETASSMEELTSTVRQNADNAKQANQLALNASDIAIKGGQVVGDVVQTMASISTSSKKIVDIISVIEDIAFQTNILALNAAVEAARAGEQGRGFAVVAGEVRNLAQRSAAASKEIKALIGDSVEKVDAGTKQVDQAGATMAEIVQAVKRVTDIMSEISAASTEQSDGIEQVNTAITQMDEVTQQNAALVEEAAAAAESMEEQAEALSKAVSIFKLDRSETPVKTVIAEPAAASPVPTMPETIKQKVKPAGSRFRQDEDWKEF